MPLAIHLSTPDRKSCESGITPGPFGFQMNEIIRRGGRCKVPQVLNKHVNCCGLLVLALAHPMLLLQVRGCCHS